MRLTELETMRAEEIARSLVFPLPAEAAELIKQGYQDLREELDELRHLFDLQQRRTTEATELWRKENPGNDLVLPDLGTLLTWLMERRMK